MLNTQLLSDAKQQDCDTSVNGTGVVASISDAPITTIDAAFDENPVDADTIDALSSPIEDTIDGPSLDASATALIDNEDSEHDERCIVVLIQGCQELEYELGNSLAQR